MIHSYAWPRDVFLSIQTSQPEKKSVFQFGIGLRTDTDTDTEYRLKIVIGTGTDTENRKKLVPVSIPNY